MNKFWKKIFNFENVFLSAVTLLIVQGILRLTMGLSFLNPMGSSMDNFSISDIFFQIENASDVKDINPDIVLVDISDVYDRNELATLINQIDAAHPKTIGLDIIFEGVKDDAIANKHLIDAISNASNIVLSCKLTQYDPDDDTFYDIVDNFFSDDLQDKSKGYTNLTIDNGTQMLRNMSYVRSYMGDTIASFSNLIYHNSVSKKPTIKDDNFIVFNNQEFFTLGPKEIDTFSSIIKDKIVLVGAVNDEADKYFTPIGRLPGVAIHAFSILSIIESERSLAIPVWVNVLIAFILIYIALLVVDWIDDLCEKNRILKHWSNTITVLFVFTFLLIVVFYDYYLYSTHHIYIDLGLCLLGIGLIDWIKEIYSAVLNTFTIIQPERSKLLTKSKFYR
ncbi:MAG: CHASE2 domain-containing protein [Bacteroidales bacterium]|nr:CHASE2 domain-containing protein [Bacteroidales bacterium]